MFYNIRVLMCMCYTVCYFTGIFYAVVREISMLFIDNKHSVFCNTEKMTKQQNSISSLTDSAKDWMSSSSLAKYSVSIVM